MTFGYGQVIGNSNLACRLYAETYPTRRYPVKGVLAVFHCAEPPTMVLQDTSRNLK